jgi:hypothetical protein
MRVLVAFAVSVTNRGSVNTQVVSSDRYPRVQPRSTVARCEMPQFRSQNRTLCSSRVSGVELSSTSVNPVDTDASPLGVEDSSGYELFSLASLLLF